VLGDTIELVNTVVGTLAGIVCKLLSDPKGSAGNDVKLAVALVKLVLIGVANVLTKDGTGKDGTGKATYLVHPVLCLPP
jgi:hypothetical protein